MKSAFQFLLIFFTLTTYLANDASAQFKPAPVEKSNQKVLYQGKVYYIHTVKENQTLYSISRAYGVTPQDIAAANPNVALEVISLNQTLKIPSISALNEFSESYFGLTENDFIHHTVKPQETLHYLSKKYNVSKQQIIYYNPGSEDVIQVGQIIKIPKKYLIEKKIEKPEPTDANSYLVKKGDTLYSLSKKFGISISKLIQANPELRWGLKTGMTLSLTDTIFDPYFELKDSVQLHRVPTIDLYSDTECDSIEEINSKEPIKIALLLPFHANELLTLDSISNDSIRNAHYYNKFRKIGISFTEFYEGFILAIDSLRDTGADVTLFTYDTKSDTNITDKIITELEIIKPHLIYGPIIPNNIKRVSAFSEKNKIPMVLPLQKSKDLYTNGNPYAISLMPEVKTEINQCADYLSQFYNKNIILIHNEDSIGYENVKEFRETLFAYFSSKAAYDEALFKEIRVNDTLKQNLEHTLRQNMDNIVIIVSKSEAYVSNIIGLLRINQSLGYSINAFGLPVWQTFKNLRIELLHQLNTVLYTPFYIDFTKPQTKIFVNKCRNELGFEPYKTTNNGSGLNFTYLGYEAGLVITEAFNKQGPKFINCLCNLQVEMPQTNYTFKWDSKGGFSNSNVNFINFSVDYKLQRIEFESLTEINNNSKKEELENNPFIQ